MASPLSSETVPPSRNRSPENSPITPITASPPTTNRTQDEETTSPESPSASFAASGLSSSPDAKSVTSREEGRSDRAIGLERGDRRFLTVASLIALLLMAAQWIRIMGWTPAFVEVERPAGEDYRLVLDVNAANWVEWMQLDGIGETLARRIVADREQNGPFLDVESVQRVPGIGPKTLERIRLYLVTTGPHATEATGD